MGDTAAWPIGQIRRTSAAFVAALLLFSGFAASPQASEDAGRFVTVILQGFKWGDAQAAVKSVEGRVTQELPIINGVSARVRTSDIDELRSHPGVFNVERNAKIEFQGQPDAGIPQRVQKAVNADKLWSKGITGKGVTVAVLDTGVHATHPDLAGRVIHCEDLSHERGTEAHCQDTFGHGTFMAGLIAGDGTSSNGMYKGAAPEASIVAIKAAGFDGSTDVSNILAGIQWAVAFKDVFGIDILSLSLGTDSTAGTRLSPLNFAVERAWAAGIVVVTSSSNRGPGAETVTSPGDDPYVITVGSSNDEGTATVRDDQVPVFSGRGPTAEGLAKPDVVAPGVSTVSLRAPGSYIDQNYGSTAAIGSSYFKGTGTSMSTATVAGIAAQILHSNPLLSPDQVKYRLMETAQPIANQNPTEAGRGLVNAYAAATSLSTGAANQDIQPSTGLGSIQAARGSLDVWVTNPEGDSLALSGEVTANTDPTLADVLNPLGLVSYDPVSFTSTGWDATKWSATKWSGTKWSGTKWSGAEFSATKWSGTKWSGTKWSNADWDATKWSSIDWDATKWSGTKWSTAWYAVAWN